MTEKKKKRVKGKLPKKIIPIANADKIGWHEKWTKSRSLGNLPHPFRCALIGPPNVGKTTLVKNLILHAKPSFEEIYVIHCDPDFTKEYDDVEPNDIMKEVPPPEEWIGEVKTLVIIDDVDFTGSSKEQMYNLSRLFGFCSTHKNISICLCYQEFFNLPKICRRLCNVFVIWKPTDMDQLNAIGRKCGLKNKDFEILFDRLITEKRDSLCVDMTANSPAPLRKNIFEIITKNNKK
jgi:Cdc6-like AAA superfamily ATPase